MPTIGFELAVDADVIDPETGCTAEEMNEVKSDGVLSYPRRTVAVELPVRSEGKVA